MIIISKPLCVLAIQGVPIYFSTLMILLYITRNVQTVITTLIYQLSTYFELKVLEPLRYFLDLQVDYKSLWLLFINGNTFSNSWLNFTSNSKPCSMIPSPVSSSSTLCISTASPLFDPTQSRSLVGSLQYAAFTKPNIAFVAIALMHLLLSSFNFQHFMPICAHSQLKSNHHEVDTKSLYYILFICVLFQLKSNHHKVDVISLYYILFNSLIHKLVLFH